MFFEEFFVSIVSKCLMYCVNYVIKFIIDLLLNCFDNDFFVWKNIMDRDNNDLIDKGLFLNIMGYVVGYYCFFGVYFLYGYLF